MLFRSYRSLNTSNPAAFSPSIVQGELRDKMGFDGAIITDDLDANGVTDLTSPQQAAVNSLKAGNDLILFAQSGGSATGALRTVVKSIKGGKLSQATVQSAYDKVIELKDQLPAK